MSVIIVYSQKCTGCRACEIACSFHHEKLFNRKMSSIEVMRYEKEARFEVIVHEEPVDMRKGCDLCRSEAIPLCIKYCSVGALKLKALEEARTHGSCIANE